MSAIDLNVIMNAWLDPNSQIQDPLGSIDGVKMTEGEIIESILKEYESDESKISETDNLEVHNWWDQPDNSETIPTSLLTDSPLIKDQKNLIL